MPQKKMKFLPETIDVIDSHTAGEPTRVVIAGGPDLGEGSLAERAKRFSAEFDHYRSAIIQEPRGNDFLVGALLTTPVDPKAAAGVIFFNNVGLLGMCGHGTIGVAVTLAHLGRISTGSCRLETPVGPVCLEYHGGAKVTIENVPSYRYAQNVTCDVPGVGQVTGDIAWGGNWFYLVHRPEEIFQRSHAVHLLDLAWKIRQALRSAQITGADGAEIDHVELFGPPENSENHARNFVLCPGREYDRSPCGTGTSAKIACLMADGKLQPGELWRQESITGSLFTGNGQWQGDKIIPRITGAAYITAIASLHFQTDDPLKYGV